MSFLVPVASLALGAVGLGTSLIGGMTQATGTLQQGAATSEAAAYQAQVASNNQAIAARNADIASAAGQGQAAIASETTAQNVGAVKVAQAASGIDVNKGSAVAVQKSAREVGALNAATTLSNVETGPVYGYRTAAVSYGAQAKLEKIAAGQAIIGSEIGAAGQELGAAGSAASTAASLAFKWGGGGTTGAGSADNTNYTTLAQSMNPDQTPTG